MLICYWPPVIFSKCSNKTRALRRSTSFTSSCTHVSHSFLFLFNSHSALSNIPISNVAAYVLNKRPFRVEPFHPQHNKSTCVFFTIYISHLFDFIFARLINHCCIALSRNKKRRFGELWRPIVFNE